MNLPTLERDPTKPYFEGQTPQACGHYYPDVVRIRDRVVFGARVATRILDCVYCGRKEVEIPASQHLDVVFDERRINEFREAERARLLARKSF